MRVIGFLDHQDNDDVYIIDINTGCNPDLKEAFPKPPMASLRQRPNLGRQLCKATLSKLSRNSTRATNRTTAGWRRCSTTTGRRSACLFALFCCLFALFFQTIFLLNRTVFSCLIALSSAIKETKFFALKLCEEEVKIW